jgi:hypothetical protein
MNNPNQNFQEVNYNLETNYCSSNLFNCIWFTTKEVYDQECTFCTSTMLINSTRKKDIVEEKDKKKMKFMKLPMEKIIKIIEKQLV